jgi:hypothetical protein
MKALFIPFPLSRRRRLVRALAAKMAAAATSPEAERCLQGRAARLRRGLCRKRVAEAVIDRELRALEAAVRTELWRLMFAPSPREV